VTGNGAYGEEMNEVALFESALRAAVPMRPDPRIQADFVRRLAGVARAATVEAETRRARRGFAARRHRSRRALAARIGLAVAAIPLAFAGLAFAGVNLPQPARDAFDSVGIELPNQPSEQSNEAPDQGFGSGGNDVSDAAKSGPSSDQGNSAAAHRHALDQRAKARGRAIGHSKGKAIGLNELTPPGQSHETTPPEHPTPPAQAQSHSAPDTRSSTGGGSSQPFPPQASGQALGRSK
jgi:hypothetical protein